MVYQWDSTLETGHAKVDNQHKQLVAALNDLIEASYSDKGEKTVMDTLDFLTGYTIKHFSDEEKLQKDSNYPDYLNHKRIHENFKLTVKGMVEQVKKEGPTKKIMNDVTESLGSWLINHIKGDDFRMAAYVKSKGL